jgi:hypothetical protein
VTVVQARELPEREHSAWPRRVESALEPDRVTLLAASAAFWLVSLPRIHTSAIGTLGLLSAIPVTMYVAFALLAVSMVRGIHAGASNRFLASHLVLFVLMLHATPALTYETLRYAWAWKHLGLVDELARHHTLVSGPNDLGVYHNWPGFFTVAATWLCNVGGLNAWIGIVQWAPPFFELLALLAVYSVLQALDTDRRLVWLGVWFFAIGNWIGQDYFSPQAFVFFLYLAVIALVLRLQARHPTMPRWLHNRFARGLGDIDPVALRHVSKRQVRNATVLAAILATAIITSHPLTPFVLLAALALLAITRVVPIRKLPLMVLTIEVLWLLTGARSYVSDNARSIIAGFGELQSNVNQSLVHTEKVESAQRLVAAMGRLEVIALIAFALLGILRRIRRGRWDAAAALLAIAPIVIVMGSSYGGEATFRVYLFALPFLAFFAASFCYPAPRTQRTASAVVALAISALVLTSTMFAYYGKDQWSHFTKREVQAAEVMFAQAPNGSVVVEGGTDYPTRFERAQDLTYVDLTAEPASSWQKVLEKPVGTLYGWLSDSRYRGGYIIITRSQKTQSDALGMLPKGALDRIENALLASPFFKVVWHDRDASVLTVARGAEPQ